MFLALFCIFNVTSRYVASKTSMGSITFTPSLLVTKIETHRTQNNKTKQASPSHPLLTSPLHAHTTTKIKFAELHSSNNSSNSSSSSSSNNNTQSQTWGINYVVPRKKKSKNILFHTCGRKQVCIQTFSGQKKIWKQWYWMGTLHRSYQDVMTLFRMNEYSLNVLSVSCTIQNVL